MSISLIFTLSRWNREGLYESAPYKLEEESKYFGHYCMTTALLTLWVPNSWQAVSVVNQSVKTCSTPWPVRFWLTLRRCCYPPAMETALFRVQKAPWFCLEQQGGHEQLLEPALRGAYEEGTVVQIYLTFNWCNILFRNGRAVEAHSSRGGINCHK